MDIRGRSNQIVAIDAEQRSRIFAMNSLAGAYKLTLSYLTLLSGKVVAASNFDANTHGDCTTISGYGGAICSVGELILDNVIIDGSQARYGGGILTGSNPVTLNNTTVKDNTATRTGGGIYASTGTVTLNNSDILSNNAQYGAGIYAEKTMRINDSTVAGNTASENGGGVEGNTTVEIIGSTIQGNKATRGAGIRLQDGAYLKLTDSEVQTNQATNSGGGIFAYENNRIIIKNSEISANNAYNAGSGIWGDHMNLSVTDSAILSNTGTLSWGTYGGGIFGYNDNRIELKIPLLAIIMEQVRVEKFMSMTILPSLC